MFEDDNELLDLVREGFGLDNDAQLADYLKMSRPTIYNIRKRNGKLGGIQRLHLLDKLGFLATRSVVESVSPRSLANKIRGFTQRTAVNIANNNLGQNVITSAKEIVYLLMQLLQINSKKDLEVYLDITPSTFDRVVNDIEDFDIISRLKIIENLSKSKEININFPISNIVALATNTEELLQHISDSTEDEQISNDPEENLIENFKSILNFKDDKSLAKELGVSPQHISQSKQDVSKLGIRPRIKMLALIDSMTNDSNKFDPEELITLLSDSEAIYKKARELQTTKGK
jgi:hypothetical protein